MISYIAQSFVLDTLSQLKVDGAGAFISSVDLFFASRDYNSLITVEIREIDSISRQITNKVIPFSQTIVKSAALNLSFDGSAATNIRFSSPIYLINGNEYALVIYATGGNSNYRVFTARLGQNDLLSGNRVSAQPAAGMLYDSGLAIPEEDLKFVLYVADFITDTTGSLVFKNNTLDFLVVANTTGAFNMPGEGVRGETLLSGVFANTKAVSTAFSNTYAQGMTSGATGTITAYTAGSGGRVKIKNVSITSKFKGGEVIRIRSGNATTGPIVGNSTGKLVCTTTPIGFVRYYDSVNFSNNHLHLYGVTFSNSGPANTTNRTFTSGMAIRSQNEGYTADIISIESIKGDVFKITSDFIQPSNTSLSLSAKMAKSTSSRDSTYQTININNDTEFTAPRYILSRSIESNTSSSTATMASDRSAEFKFDLNSTSRLSSPAFDMGRLGLTMIENLINSNSAIGSTESTKSGGNAKSRYISRQVTLADGQDAEDLKVFVTAYKPPAAEVSVYYKILNSEDSDLFSDARWTLMTQNTGSGFTSTSVSSSSVDSEDFIELAFDPTPLSTTSGTYTQTGAPENFLNGANTTNNGVLEYRNSKRARYIGFKKFAIKIVLSSTISSNPPRIRDFRAIALQK